jgi:hypothetical protein
MEPTIKVTKIKDRYHARLLCGDKVIDEMACASQLDIGWICREMLRWYDKNGSDSKFASAARKRQRTPAKGNVWYIASLEQERKKIKKKANCEL